MSNNGVGFNVAVIAAILGGAGLIAGAMVLMRPEAERREPEQVVTRVEVLETEPEDRPALVQAPGTVEPARQVSLMPQVTGRIIWQ
ncbi:MAG: hypothetical protein AAF211_28660, partial [Myxococcota bacterium]